MSEFLIAVKFSGDEDIKERQKVAGALKLSCLRILDNDGNKLMIINQNSDG